MDLLYVVTNKLGLSPGFIYLSIVPLVVFLLFSMYGKYTYRDSYIFLFLVAYFVLQLINGLVNGSLPQYAFVTFISFALTIYLIQIFTKMRIEELFQFVKSIFYITIVFYMFMDFASILVMGKSQHVILTNNLPFLLLTGIAISISDKKGKISILPVIFLLVYALWIYISVVYFTSDQRFQLKALAISAVITFLFVSLYGLGKFIPRMKRLASLKVSVSLVVVVACVLFGILLYFTIKYLFDNPLEGRETSIGLRISVASLMVKDFFEGSIFDWLFGFGLGSSMQEFPASIGTQIIFLKSHSGLLSLFYEHGTLFILLILLMFVKFTKAPVLSGRLPSAEKRHYKIYNVSLLITIFMVWIMLNTVYLIAINVPNYGSQSQLVSSLLLLVFLNRVIFSAQR